LKTWLTWAIASRVPDADSAPSSGCGELANYSHGRSAAACRGIVQQPRRGAGPAAMLRRDAARVGPAATGYRAGAALSFAAGDHSRVTVNTGVVVLDALKSNW
jgi:hypothetical protein